MIPTLPQNKFYFSLEEVCQWVDITPEALRCWLSAQGTSLQGLNPRANDTLPINRRYHRREVLWLCKVKPEIEQLAKDLLGKPIDLTPVRQELQAMLEALRLPLPLRRL